MGTDGSGLKKLAIGGFTVYKKRIYFSDRNGIYSMKLNGTNVKTEVKGNYEFMAVENSYLYYDLSTYGTNGFSKKIYRKKLAVLHRK
jgi:hypothetical protein